MKRKHILILILLVLGFACKSKDDGTKNLSDYLSLYHLKIDNNKVICFVPVDGCGSCIDPTLNHVKEAKESFLMILTSIRKKSIHYTIERMGLENTFLIKDSSNQAVKRGLTTDLAPTYYFIKNGSIVKKVDLNLLTDKVSILKEVDDYLKKN
jgi:hypothetical protein